MSFIKLSKKFDISVRSIQEWLKGNLPKGTRNKFNTKLDINKLKQDVIDYPDGYLQERATRLGVSEFCISYNLKKLNITYKKTLTHPTADEEKRELFNKKIQAYKDQGLPVCYLDESGHALDMPRTHGYSNQGQICYGVCDWGAKGRTNVIGALIGRVLFAIGVMDNGTFHKNTDMLKMITNAGHIIEFLPPYSPDLNPIENKWSEKKAYIKKHNCSIEQCYAY